MLYKTTKSNCLVLKLNKIYFKKCYSESGMLAWPWMGGELGQSERAKIKENKFIFPSFLSAVLISDETAFIDESNNGNPTRELKPGLHLVIKRYKA